MAKKLRSVKYMAMVTVVLLSLFIYYSHFSQRFFNTQPRAGKLSNSSSPNKSHQDATTRNNTLTRSLTKTRPVKEGKDGLDVSKSHVLAKTRPSKQNNSPEKSFIELTKPNEPSNSPLYIQSDVDVQRKLSISSEYTKKDPNNTEIPNCGQNISTPNKSPKTEPNKEEEKTRTQAKRVKLILLSYMRSGSTFTGDLFNFHPRVFYVYEPLWSFDFHFLKGEPLHFLNNDPIPYVNEDQLDTQQKATISNVLSCHVDELNTQILSTLKMKFSLDKSRGTFPFANCSQRLMGAGGMIRCLPLLQRACDTANVTVVKTLRFSMDQAETLLERDPTVKVIHLVRDPRGVLVSRLVTSIGIDYGVTGGQLCAKVSRDVQKSLELRTKFPGRLLTVRYEDLTADPINYAQRLLNFAGLDLSPKHCQRIWRLTSSGANVTRGIVRGNSSESAGKWRLKGKDKLVSTIDTECSALYKLMGYLPLPGKKLRDQSEPYFQDCTSLSVPVLCPK